MHCWIQKKSETFSSWNSRAFQLANCELIQYQKEVTNFKQCNDKLIKKRYNIYEIEEVKLGKASEPYRLYLKFPAMTLPLQFKQKNQPSFIAVYRILCSAQKQEYQQRAIPSNICFALYNLLQNIYKHKDILCTPFIFKKDRNELSIQDIEALYRNLIIKGRKYRITDIDIHLLSQTLLYTLQNMPTSLFCDSYCRPLTDFVTSIIQQSDGDIFGINFNKKYFINKIKDEFNKRYRNNNRFGFMSILFSLLSIVSSNKYYVKTRVSAHDLAVVFASRLQSKQYLFECRTYILSNNMHQFKAKNKEYEDNFIQMIQVLIYFAHDIFPLLRDNKWKITTLVCAQSAERQKIHQYNDHYSRDVKNEYFIGTVLRQKTQDYGYFDAKYVVDNGDDNDKENLIVPIAPYKVKTLVSMRQIPQNYSDLGISTEDEIEFDEEIIEDKEEEEEEEEEDCKYSEQLLSHADDEIEHTVYHDVEPGNLSVSSWMAQCEICLYGPLMKLFDTSQTTQSVDDRDRYTKVIVNSSDRYSDSYSSDNTVDTMGSSPHDTNPKDYAQKKQYKQHSESIDD